MASLPDAGHRDAGDAGDASQRTTATPSSKSSAAIETAPFADEHPLHVSSAMTPDTFKVFDVHRVAAELMASPRLAREAKVARVLVDNDELSLVVVALRRGGRLPEYAFPHSAIVMPISGRVTFATDGNGVVDVTSRTAMFIGRDRRHEVVAHEDAAFMLVIVKDGRIPSPVRERAAG